MAHQSSPILQTLAAVFVSAALAACEDGGDDARQMARVGSIELVRGMALRSTAPDLPEDAPGVEEFGCSGQWSQRGRSSRIGTYYAQGDTVCVEPVGEVAFCRRFRRSGDGQHLLADGTAGGGIEYQDAEYSALPIDGRPCEEVEQ